jgi:hypothetical protein
MIKLKQLLKEEKHMFGPLWHGTDDSPATHFHTKGHSYLGIYGSSDKSHATEYGKNLTKMNIVMNKPFFLDLDDKTPYHGKIVVGNRVIGVYENLDRETIDLLSKLGYDGIVVKYKGNSTFEVVSFNSKNVKILSWND